MSHADATIVTSPDGTPAAAAGLSAPAIPDVAIERELGRGGMGAVWLGRQTYLDRRVAVKALLAVADDSFAARFRREATILAGLHHPHIVACHSAGIAPDGRPYLVMEFVDGPDLKRWVAGHGPLPAAAAARVVREVAEGLAHAHAQGIIHRDVKPENVLLARRPDAAADEPCPWTAKLADLGLARPAKPAAGSAANLTLAGQLVGTPATMAPEQFDDPEGVDHRADIYGLGCVLYHALTGAPAFTGNSFAEIVASKVHGAAPEPARAQAGVPARLSALCARMLARDRGARPQDYAAVVAELRACESGAPASAGPGRLIALGVGLVVVGVVVAWLALRPAPAQPAPSVTPPVAAKPPVPTAPAPTATPALPTALPPLTGPRQLLEDEFRIRLRGWDLGPDAMWAAAEEHEGRAITGRSGWISRPLPGLPLRVTATIEVPAGESWDWWLAGVRLADGQLVAVRATNLGTVTAKIETRRTADPMQAPADSTADRDLPAGGGGPLRLDITAERIAAVVSGVGIGDAPLTSPPVALVFASLAERPVTVVDPVAAPR